MRASAGSDRNNELVMLTGAGKVPRFECVGFGKAIEINRRVTPY